MADAATILWDESSNLGAIASLAAWGGLCQLPLNPLEMRIYACYTQIMTFHLVLNPTGNALAVSSAEQW